MLTLNIKREQLWNGCMLASIAHAVMTARYPELSFEQSWDGLNYNVQDGAGTRGTITFQDAVTVAAFRNEHSSRCGKYDVTHTLLNAPEVVHSVAVSETLQYLLDEVAGQTVPVITSLFWGVNDDFTSNDALQTLLQNGGEIIKTQLSGCTTEAITQWQQYYDMTRSQVGLVLSLYERKVMNPETEIRLTRQETNLIGLEDADGIDECRESLSELGIVLPE